MKNKFLFIAVFLLLNKTVYASIENFLGVEFGSASINANTDAINNSEDSYVILKIGGTSNNKHRFSFLGIIYNSKSNEDRYSVNFFYDYLFDFSKFKTYVGAGIGSFKDYSNRDIKREGVGIGIGLESGIIFPIFEKFSLELNLRVDDFYSYYILKYEGNSQGKNYNVIISNVGIGINYSF
ncbi:hypothetical protein [Hydrogenothermus marinus]|uniref:Outer membrane protein with beta-barrel domain n=1 Tax=Hydrogenothermus marinus TaxID=133270 RepID=A0A3M0C432_9AQUI|nr:hypothetical protein [Hydrogenothermus marinus]RMA97722.1 hypothetical protein CLV39_0345 [Hydrogenothermus marinus]